MSAMGKDAEIVAETVGLTVGAGEHPLFQNISLQFMRGQTVCLVGPNGAGKSTLLDTVVGLRRPSRGRVAIFGRNPRHVEARRRLGYVPQQTGFPRLLRVGEIVSFVRSAHPGAAWDEGVIDTLGLGALWRRQCGGLSGGEQRRVALACALAPTPDLLVLDEPTTGLDLGMQERVWFFLAAAHERGTTVLCATHFWNEMNAMGARLLVLVGGRVALDGSAQAVLGEAALFRVEVSGAVVTDAPEMLWWHEGSAPGDSVMYFTAAAAAQDFLDRLLREFSPSVTGEIHAVGVADLLRR